ncbi:MAG: hypothetical protein CW694_04670 [Candidatus Syntrophoarchaeum sp. WYZ-LMO15]|nr:MAG: hypothetical protein CW694_04670 [Candidatus Syntrophoarchaeum sp. WYZ-LMO15]
MAARKKKVTVSLMSRAFAFSEEFSDLFRYGSLGLIICILGDLIAGIELGSLGNILELLPGLVILVPPAMGMRGNIYGAFASRLGTSMHMGTFTPSLMKDTVLAKNLKASVLLTLFLSVTLGVVAKLVAYTFGHEALTISEYIFISFLGGIISAILLLPIVVAISIIGFSKGWDIDNFSAPMITAFGDVVTIPALYIAAISAMKISMHPMGLDLISGMILITTIPIFVCGIREGGLVSRIFKESVPLLLFTSTIGSFGGFLIHTRLEVMIKLAAILVLIPPFLGVNNALGGILAARLSSMLHMGIIYPRKIPERAAIKNFIAIYAFSLIIFPLVGLLTHVLGEVLGFTSPGPLVLIAMSLIAGIISTLAVSAIAYMVAAASFKLGADPDIHSIPLTSSTIDLIGILSIILTLGLF